MLLTEAIQAAGRGLQREFDLEKPIASMRRKVGEFFLLQATVTLDAFAHLNVAFPLEEAEGVPVPPWEGAWEVVVRETSADLEAIARESLPAAIETGAIATLADIGIEASFDLANPRAVAYLDNAGAALVTRVNETTRGIIKAIITEGAREGTSYQKIARRIVDEFREMAVRKPQQHIANRAELIAITELGNAYEEAGTIVGRDLSKAGLQIEKYWSTVGDDRVSAGCADNEASGWIPEFQSFPSGHDRPLRFPGCRCGLMRRMVS